ncbi:hypothetical protein [uncultured Algoriphagus sp.]|uniref:hypothetical protein n=1 Tax=uncultured Algoriphagus sp. TaxID=417365 RepID=UPI0030EB7864|tara:strand:+ start:1532 stop:1849 length:318 start_codon:yes stop_codon:yes gene_type:complete
MSGSGGGGYVPPQRNNFDCETGIIITNVSSINLTVLLKHTVGVFLNVTIGPNEQILLEDGDGEILGAVLHSNISDLIECIKNGAQYEAEIQRINTPTCVVKITRK